MRSTDEFVPLDHFYRILQLWWGIVLLTVIGAGIGYLLHLSKPSLYEAKATFMASIDYNKIDFEQFTPSPYELTQYDEDISLAMVDVSLRRVLPQVVTFAQQNGLDVDIEGLLDHTVIERQHAFWIVRVRDPNPERAQKITNYWANLAYADLRAQEKAGQLPVYIFFDLIQLAELPKTPTYLQINQFVFAGAVIGLIAGVILVNLPFLKIGKDR